MSTQDIETVHSKLDLVLVALAVLAVLAGVLGFSLLTEQTLLARIGILAGGLLLGLVLAWLSQPGKQLLGFAHESYDETKRVTWPPRKETVNTTGIVFLFVVVTALFLFLVDRGIEWILYDLLLGWR